MRAWPLIALLGSCAVPAPAPPERPPQPTVSKEDVARLLESLERTFYTHWGTVEETAEYRKLGPAHVPLLRSIVDANGECSLMAYRILRRLAPGEPFTESAKAILYATAFGRDENFIRWGTLSKAGLLPGIYGDELVSLKGAVVPFLRKSLADRRPAPVRGEAGAERANRRQADRVCDYAWVMLAGILGRPFSYDEDPLDRDRQIREFDLWLDRRR
jgi:hypothetical protein